MLVANARLDTVDEDACRAITPKRPKAAGAYWKSIPHGLLLDAVNDAMLSRGIRPHNSTYLLSPNGGTMTCAINTKIRGLDAPEGMDFGLGIINDNNLRRGLRLLVGGTIFCCSNGMVTGEIVLAAKHTKGFILGTAVERAFDTYATSAKGISNWVASMRQKELDKAMVEHLLCEAGRRSLMPWSHIGKVDAEFDAPHFAEHGKGTAWALYNAFTYVAQKSPPQKQLDSILGFRQLCAECIAV